MGPAGSRQQQDHEHARPGAPGPTSTRAGVRRWRSPLVVVGVTTAVLGALVIGGTSGDDDAEEEYDYGAVCVDEAGTRIEDERCDEETAPRGGGGAFWYFIPIGRFAPGLGQRATGGIDTSGGTVSRGGFGGRGGGGGSVGG